MKRVYSLIHGRASFKSKRKAYSFRYEYDFKEYVPGLRFMTRYTTGHNIYAPNLGGTNLKERETDFDLGYTVQSGWLKI